MTVLSDLPDDALLRVVPCHPALNDEAATAASGAITKLLTQFVREGAVQAAGCEAVHNGGFLLIAWQPTETPLSGCRQDKLSKVLQDHEQRSGSSLLCPPPIILDQAGDPRCGTQGSLRSQVAVGAVSPDSLAYDHLVKQVGEWRRGMPRPIRDIPWLAKAVERMAAKA
ncbi:MAG: hypothetical protein PF961_04815 [Planctomycetota bacterium]|jgi:hypothetical protein|nr:hypothetical protein [Planctomycetota bacterium]